MLFPLELRACFEELLKASLDEVLFCLEVIALLLDPYDSCLFSFWPGKGSFAFSPFAGFLSAVPALFCNLSFIFIPSLAGDCLDSYSFFCGAEAALPGAAAFF